MAGSATKESLRTLADLTSDISERRARQRRQVLAGLPADPGNARLLDARLAELRGMLAEASR